MPQVNDFSWFYLSLKYMFILALFFIFFNLELELINIKNFKKIKFYFSVI